MNLSTLTSLFTVLLFVASCNAQNNNKNDFEYSLESAHPKARALMTEDFFWSPTEETGPFGSDDGSDAAYGFRRWRMEKKLNSPVTYLKELMKRWNYPFFDWEELDTSKIKEYLNSDTTRKVGMYMYLIGQDNAIIGTAFAQFALEGKVDNYLQRLTITAIKRQLLPVVLDNFPDTYATERKQQLSKMLDVITKANS